jgi:kynurenine formamidase
MLEWLWEHRIAAVGGDAPAWEVLPPTCKDSAGFLYHEVLIAGWGCPIAEYLWLEDLAEYCKREKRWTMFLSSCPLNVQGGVASPANLMAIL